MQKDKKTLVSLTLRDCLSLSFQRYTFIYISYVAFIFSFFILFQRLGLLQSSHDALLATARGPHVSSLCLQTS